MGSSTDLYLPLHVRTHDLVMVLAKIMGEPYVLTSFDKDEVVSYRPYRTKKVPTPFDPSEPASQDNPWHVRFERDGKGLGAEPARDHTMSHFMVTFQDAAKNPYSWNYFPEYDQQDSDGLFLRRAKLLSPGSHPIAGAACKRLVHFFGGELFYNDGKDQDAPDVTVTQEQARFPLMQPGSSSNDQWYALYNALNSEPLLTPEELEEARAFVSYQAEDEKQASFIKAIRAFHMSLRLAQTLEEPSKPTAPKPRF